MIPANPVNPLLTLIPADPGARSRPGLPPSAERLGELKEAVRSGAYRVPPEVVAQAVLRTLASLAA
jgi:hypothetical protein